MRFGYWLGGAFLAAGVLFAVIDSVILFKGWAAYGLDWWDKLSYGTAAASIPWTIVGFPFVFWLMWMRGRWRAVFPMVVAATVYFILLAYSLIGAMGSIATQRSQVIAERKGALESVDALKDQRNRLKDQLAWIPKRRPAGTVAALLEAEKVKPAWEWSEHCRQPRNGSLRSYCTGVAVLQGELEAARKSDELGAKIEALGAKIDGRAPVAERVDPMASTLAFWLSAIRIRTTETEASLGLPLATPVVLLIGEMVFVWFGFILLGLNHRRLIASEVPTVAASPARSDRGEAVRVGGEVVAAPALPPPPPRSTLTQQQELCVWFFRTYTRPAPDGSLTEGDWYRLYSEICRRSNDEPLPVAAFRRIARKHIPVVKEIDGVTWFRGVLPFIAKESVA